MIYSLPCSPMGKVATLGFTALCRVWTPRKFERIGMSDPKDCLICVAGKSRGGVRAFALNQYPENQNSAIFLALIQTGNQKIQIDPRTGPTFGTIGSSARDQNRERTIGRRTATGGSGEESGWLFCWRPKFNE